MLTVRDDITWKTLDSGIVVLNLKTGEYYTLNETASVIWRGLVDGRSRQQITAGLMEGYDAPEEEVTGDVQAQIDLFIAEQLLSEA